MRRKGVILLFFSLLYAFVYIYYFSESDEYYKNKYIEYSGVVKLVVDKKFKRYYYIDDILAIDDKNDDNHISTGSKIKLKGKEKNLDDWYIDNFNYGRYLRSSGIRKCISLEHYSIVGEDRLYKNIGKLRKFVVDTNRYLYKDSSKTLNAVLIGFKDDYDDNDKFLYSDSGTSHIMAISGMHVGLLCFVLILFFGKINNIFRLIFLIMVLILYFKLVGEGISIFRAIIFFIMIKLTFFIDKKGDIINILSIIGGYSIIKNPYVIYNISFQLSFLSVASISIYNKYILKYVYFPILSSSIAVMLLTVPILAYNFKEISLVSIAGNLVVLPLILIIVVLDILTIVFYGLNLNIGHIIAMLNTEIIKYVNQMLKIIGNFGVNNLYFKDINIYQVLIYYTFISVITVFIHINQIRKNRYDLTYSMKISDKMMDEFELISKE